MKNQLLLLAAITSFTFLGCSSSDNDLEEKIVKTFTGSVTLSQSTFIDTEVDLTNSLDLMVKNTGNQPLVVSSITSSDNAFTISPTSANISTGSEKKFTITFKPTLVKLYSTTISVLSNSTVSLTAAVSGKGIVKTNTIKTTYETDIKPIMTQSCATTGCHNSTSKSSGIDLSSFALVKAGFQSKGALDEIESGRMPRNASKLSQDKINLLKKWISDGYIEKN